METISYETFRRLLENGIASAIEDAQKIVSDPLPQQMRFELANFKQNGKESSLNEILSYLYKDGTFPKIVDIAIKGIKDDCTLIWIRASGHEFVDALEQTWNTPKGTGPFKSMGLMLPYALWNRPRPFSKQDLVEAGQNWLRSNKVWNETQR